MIALIPAIILIGLAVLGIAVKMIFIKGSNFTKTCGSVDPKTGKKVACTCGNENHERKENCKNENI